MEAYHYSICFNQVTHKYEVQSYTASRPELRNLIAECPSLIVAQRVADALERFC